MFVHIADCEVFVEPPFPSAFQSHIVILVRPCG
jgi:hypothetical protein